LSTGGFVFEHSPWRATHPVHQWRVIRSVDASSCKKDTNTTESVGSSSISRSRLCAMGITGNGRQLRRSPQVPIACPRSRGNTCAKDVLRNGKPGLRGRSRIWRITLPTNHRASPMRAKEMRLARSNSSRRRRIIPAIQAAFRQVPASFQRQSSATS